MPVTSDDVKTQIVLEVGDVNPQTGDPATTPGQPGSDGIVYARIDYLWDRYAAWDQVGGGLRELHCRAAGIRLVLGVLAPRRFDNSDTRSGLSVRAHQLVESYQAKLEQTMADIESGKAEAGLATWTGSGPYQSGRLLTRVPRPTGAPPYPTDIQYGGTVRGVRGP